MSVILPHGEKVILSRTGADEFWNRIREHYAVEDPRKWKYLAMLALRENAGWPLECIGRAFGHQLHRRRVDLLARLRHSLPDELFGNPGDLA